MSLRGNDPCPCGSGKEYKDCCLLKFSERAQIPSDILRQIIEHNRRVALLEHQFGQVRPTVSADFQGHKFVAVGNQLLWSKKWKTVPDFLIDYTKQLFGDWGNGELKKQLDERHQIINWYVDMCLFQQRQIRQENGLYSAIPNGAFSAFIHLGYDLYTLQHNSIMQTSLVNRLKSKDQFQGARYELFTAATCIRAGYDIEYEDEGDVTKKHPEFIAKHKATGQVITVEAKSRHREGVLGFHDNSTFVGQIKAGIGRLLSEALQKAGEHPHVIFIDLNLPRDERIVFERPIFTEIRDTIEFICRNGDERDRFALLVITNHPHYYGGEDEPDPAGDTMIVLPKNPLIVPDHPESIMALYQAAEQYSNIPNFFTDH
jgi:hypothetical protein